MKLRVRELSFAVFCLAVAVTRPAISGTLYERTAQFEYDGEIYSGEYLVYLPSVYAAGKSMPLLLLFHGIYGSCDAFMESSGYQGIAEEKGFIVASLDAVVQDDFLPKGWYIPFHFPFADAVLENIRAEFSVDSSRIYCTGMSSGGFFSSALALSRSRTFAAFGERSAGYWPDYEPVAAERKIPAVLTHGDNDPIVPIGLPGASAEFALLLSENGNDYSFRSLSGVGHEWRVGDSESEWDFLFAHSLPEYLDNYLELSVEGGAGGVFKTGDRIRLRWDAYPAAYGYSGRIFNVYLAFLVNPSVENGTAEYSDILMSEAVYVFGAKLRPDLYAGGTPRPTYSGVPIPLGGTTAWGEMTFDVPRGMNCRGAFAAFLLDGAGQPPSDPPVEVSEGFDISPGEEL